LTGKTEPSLSNYAKVTITTAPYAQGANPHRAAGSILLVKFGCLPAFTAFNLTGTIVRPNTGRIGEKIGLAVINGLSAISLFKTWKPMPVSTMVDITRKLVKPLKALPFGKAGRCGIRFFQNRKSAERAVGFWGVFRGKS
jgi:hypothetical protein